MFSKMFLLACNRAILHQLASRTLQEFFGSIQITHVALDTIGFVLTLSQQKGANGWF
jgi:hypothetical protein